MAARKTSILAWLYCVVSFAVSVITLGQIFFAGAASLPPFKIIDITMSTLIMLLFVFLGALIVSRQPRNLIGWLLILPSAAFTFDWIGRQALRALPTSPVLQLLVAWFSNWSWLLLILPLLLILLLFPSGRPPSPRWRWAGYAIITWGAIFILAVTFQASITHLDGGGPPIPNPVGFLSETVTGDLIAVLQIVLITLTALSLAAFLVRFWRGSAIEKGQIKWLLLAFGAFASVYIAGFIFQLGGTDTFAGNVWSVFFWFAIMGIPLSIAIAILRSRLWDIDVIIRKTLVWGALTVSLGLLYFGAVTVLQSLFASVSGEQSPAAVVLSTLAIAALFNPLRRRVQDFVDRRFYRRRYDAEQTLERFAASLRNEVDLEQLCAHLVSAVRNTMNPEIVELWLKPSSTNLNHFTGQGPALGSRSE